MADKKKVWISAGGNVGNVKLTLASALQDIELAQHTSIAKVSSLYRTKAWGNEDQDDFLNIAFEIKTELKPEALLLFCQEIEAKYKRERLVKWGPRTLDLDILTYEGLERFQSPILTLPHSFMTQRNFVLLPLNEIASALVVQGKMIKEWTEVISHEGIVKLTTESNWWKAR